MDINGKKTGGRKKGTTDKFNGSVKDSVIDVFEKLGGTDGLYKWAAENPSNKRIFYSSFMKMLPREVHVQNGESPESLPFRVVIEGDKDANA